VAEKVVLDRDSFKALASETRISILKALNNKRLTITQLSKELKVSKPALLKHMEALIDAKLVKKEQKERKWIYYDLTFKGKNVLHPERVAVTVLLSSAVMAIIGAILALGKFMADTILGGSGSLAGGGQPTEAYGLSDAGPAILNDLSMLLVGIALIVVFTILVLLVIQIKKKYSKPRF